MIEMLYQMPARAITGRGTSVIMGAMTVTMHTIPASPTNGSAEYGRAMQEPAAYGSAGSVKNGRREACR
jgi:hypothetical protein